MFPSMYMPGFLSGSPFLKSVMVRHQMSRPLKDLPIDCSFARSGYAAAIFLQISVMPAWSLKRFQLIGTFGFTGDPEALNNWLAVCALALVPMTIAIRSIAKEVLNIFMLECWRG